VRGEWLYVDGEPFLVKGIGYSPYRPGQVPGSDRVDLAVMERDFQRIAAAGFNTLRTWSPLPPEALALAERYGLMVLQGLQVEPNSDYTSRAFREALLSVVRQEVERAQGHANVLAFLVGNEFLPEAVFQAGVPEIERLLKRASQAVKGADQTRLVSYANWSSLAFLDVSTLDLVCFSLHPHEPSNVSFTFGFRSYIEHLKRAVARERPLIVTEVGRSVSPVGRGKAGDGGLKPDQQAADVVTLWDDLFQAGSQGGVVFEWNDEWWKHADTATDAQTHEPDDPEEWFGLIEFDSREDRDGHERPLYQAVSRYNQAILLSPVSGERYQEQVPVTVYATERVAQIRVRLDRRRWLQATKLNRHWWKVMVPLDQKDKPGEHVLEMEALDAKHRPALHRERTVLVGPSPPSVALTIATDRPSYEAGDTIEPVRYTLTVTDGTGTPLANRPVSWSVIELPSHVELTQTKPTDASGRVEGTYLARQPGIVLLSAATPVDPAHPLRRVGAEKARIVRTVPVLTHHPSIWEKGLPLDVAAELRRHAHPAFQLADPGRERIIDYERYGVFQNFGTAKYRYDVKDWEGIAAAAGEGVYPNEGGLLHDPAYQTAKQAGKLSGSHWDFTFNDDPQLAFFKWASTDEEVGVKQFYTALTLERAGLLLQAVKAYHAVLVHFPTSVGWTAFDPPTPWYVARVARDKIEAILRLHPELGMRLEDASLVIQNGFDNDVENDVIAVHPGRFVAVAPDAVHSPMLAPPEGEPHTVGKGRVRLARDARGHWRLLVDGQPWIIHGVTYKPTAVGESPDLGPLLDWSSADRNKNGVLDALETFVDANRNNVQDPDEPAVGDFEMLHAIGVNTLRFYHTDHDPETLKRILRTLHARYGFRVILGDFVGMYTVGSGAKWEDGTDYLNKTQRRRMFESVKRMVRHFKDEPSVLMWVLGNENNYGGVHGIVGGVGNAGKHPKEYYSFINELARWIHSVDRNHPVAIGNGDLLFLDLIAKHAPAIDVFGANAYRGPHGFGRSFFEEVRRWLDKPVLIAEFGCPAYQTSQPREAAEMGQAMYHLGSWVDLADNMAGRGVGNAIGGVAFEWSDEWWKAGQPPRFSPTVQETRPNWAGPFPGGWNFEEWYGLVSQGDGHLSPFLRQLRTSYRMYQELWKRY
jgi:beta-glucuronidase